MKNKEAKQTTRENIFIFLGFRINEGICMNMTNDSDLQKLPQNLENDNFREQKHIQIHRHHSQWQCACCVCIAHHSNCRMQKKTRSNSNWRAFIKLVFQVKRFHTENIDWIFCDNCRNLNSKKPIHSQYNHIFISNWSEQP